MGKKRGNAGSITPAEAQKKLLRLFNTMFNTFGVMPDVLKAQDLEFFALVRSADEEPNEIPMSYPEDVDFT